MRWTQLLCNLKVVSNDVSNVACDVAHSASLIALLYLFTFIWHIAARKVSEIQACTVDCINAEEITVHILD